MKHLLPIFIILLTTYCNLFAQSNNEDYIQGAVIFKINPEYKSIIKGTTIQHNELQEIFSKSGVSQIVQKFPNSKVSVQKQDKFGRTYSDLTTIYEINIAEDQDIFDVISSLKKLDIIEYAHPHYLPQLLSTPDDPLNVNQQWYIEKIGAYQAFDLHQGDTTFVIGITDTGTDIDHEDLVYNIAYNWDDPLDGIDNDSDGFTDNFRGWDLAENDNNPQADSLFHGTWVSGLCAPETDNGIGLTGAAYKCKYMPIKISDNNNQLTMSYEGIVYAADHGCKIINCSWGGTAYTEMGQDVINYATINCDALVVAACGNENNQKIYYPASYEYALSVAATTQLDQKWSPSNTATTGGSNYNYLVDISAPGAMVYTSDDGGYLMGWGGTSFAAPIVSGAAAFVWSYFPEMSALQIGELLKISSDLIDTIPDNLDFAGLIGTGRLNMYKAITMEHTPSLVFEQITIEDDRENNYENSDVVNVKGKLINYLDTAYNTIINISCTNENIQLLTTQFEIGTLYTMGSYNINVPAIMFRILPDLAYNSTIVLNLNYEADGYAHTQSIEVFVKPGYKDLNANKICLSIPGNGRYGYYDIQRKIGMGMRYNLGESLFYDCGIISGTDFNHVFTAVRQSSDFYTIEHPIKTETGETAYQEIISKMDDRNDINSLGIEILTKAMAWDDENYQNFAIIEYKFINTSSSPIEGFYAGIFSDWDITESLLNRVAYDTQNALLYSWYTGNQSMYAGMQLLTNQSENHYALDNIPGGDGLVDLTNGFTDSEKFYVISNSRDQAGTNEEGNDIIGVISAGPIDIMPNDTARIAFALHASSSLYSLQLSAQQAKHLYQDILYPSTIDQTQFSELNIFPNPNSGGFEIKLPNNLLGETAMVTISDVLGKSHIKNTIQIHQSNMYFETNLKDGLYIITVETEQKKYLSKLIIQHQ